MHPLPAACDLCGHPALAALGAIQGRPFFRCPQCRQMIADPARWPTPAAEKARYDLHDNRWDNADYRGYLRKIVDHFIGLCPQARRVLDFGSGPEAVLARLLRESGREAHAYDPLYGLAPATGAAPFEALILCEVFEHLRNLDAELDLIRRSLTPTGVIYIRTALIPTGSSLESWAYLNDLTHIRFLDPESLPALARRLGCGVLQTDRRQWVLLGSGPA